jgi:uncharacterized protein (TIGR02246 family)
MADDPRQVSETILRQLEEAWNAADGAAFAVPFTEDADFVAVRGDYNSGREAIARGHQAIFDGIYRGSTVRRELIQARALTEDVILAHSTQVMDAPSGPLAGTHKATATMVLVRTAEGWRIAAYQNTLVTG